MGIIQEKYHFTRTKTAKNVLFLAIFEGKTYAFSMISENLLLSYESKEKQSLEHIFTRHYDLLNKPRIISNTIPSCFKDKVELVVYETKSNKTDPVKFTEDICLQLQEKYINHN
ncbi:MAG: hypothetical protein INQ03_17870 [Candidatus Heimdallarchaeota archaeon]|nr:hypothetical protein [Candidatus Heimdallarchaeota archaeon]